VNLAGERGFTLIELLVGLAVSLSVLVATLTTFESFMHADRDNNARNDTAEIAREALDTQARQLRNLAKRVASPVIDTLLADDLIFQTNDPNRTWVRYCLATAPPASVSRGRLWVGERAVPSAATPSPVSSAMRSACPGTGWSSTRIVADFVTNRRAGLNRPVFEYTCSAETACTSSPATYDQVVNISARTIVDTTPDRDPPELAVLSSVYLRNQNQPPVASWQSSPASASRTVVLNASGSSDYEGRTMNYYWFKQPMPSVAAINCAQPTIVDGGPGVRTLWGADTNYLGEGITLTYTFPIADGLPGSTRTIGLVVCDPGDRYPTAGVLTQAVQIPT
jgi:prepilin-type N-terminal cleavage/methylation domain-containing protein